MSYFVNNLHIRLWHIGLVSIRFLQTVVDQLLQFEYLAGSSKSRRSTVMLI